MNQLGGVYGPVGYFYDTDLSPIESLGNMVITTSSGEAIEVEINKYKMWDDNQPADNVKLRDILQEEKEEVLAVKSYSSYSAEKEHNGGFTFSCLSVDYIVPFLYMVWLNCVLNGLEDSRTKKSIAEVLREAVKIILKRL